MTLYVMQALLAAKAIAVALLASDTTWPGMDPDDHFVVGVVLMYIPISVGIIALLIEHSAADRIIRGEFQPYPFPAVLGW
jgi:hypothetical protein